METLVRPRRPRDTEDGHTAPRRAAPGPRPHASARVDAAAHAGPAPVAPSPVDDAPSWVDQDFEERVFE